MVSQHARFASRTRIKQTILLLIRRHLKYSKRATSNTKTTLLRRLINPRTIKTSRNSNRWRHQPSQLLTKPNSSIHSTKMWRLSRTATESLTCGWRRPKPRESTSSTLCSSIKSVCRWLRNIMMKRRINIMPIRIRIMDIMPNEKLPCLKILSIKSCFNWIWI